MNYLNIHQRPKLIIVSFLAAISLLSLFAIYQRVSAGAVTVSETCNVSVKFTATVPDSIEQGKSFTVTNLTVQPASSYSTTVTSSVFDMTATNTSSTTYSQSFSSTNPSPTTGHSTYVGIYPNWSLNATGPVGSSITIKIKKTVTVVQGYGTVSCNFTKTLATIPITAPAPPSPAPSASPSHSPASTSSPTSSPQPSNTTTPDSKTTTTIDIKTADGEPKTVNASVKAPPVTVVPLLIEVHDNSDQIVKGAVVTLDGSQKITTDDRGRAIFSNVLTGGHNIDASYKDQKASRNIDVNAEDVGNIIFINLPAPTVPLGIIAASGAGLTATAGAVFGLWTMRRKRSLQSTNLALPTEHLTYIPGVVAGSVVESQSGFTMLADSSTPIAEAPLVVPLPEPEVPTVDTESIPEVVQTPEEPTVTTMPTPVLAPIEESVIPTVAPSTELPPSEVILPPTEQIATDPALNIEPAPVAPKF